MVTLATVVARVKSYQALKTPKMVLVSESGYKVTVPFAPPSNSVGNIGYEWSRSARAGRESQFRFTGKKNKTIDMDFFLGGEDNQTDVWPTLARFISLANRKERVQLVYTRGDAGLYLITSFDYDILDRRAADHEPSRVSISITFTYAGALSTKNTAKKTPAQSSTTVKKTTSTTKKTTTKATATKSSSTAKTYKVVRGDSLWKISVKFYKNGNYWRKIADYNKLSNPNLIFPGQTLKIPAL